MPHIIGYKRAWHYPLATLHDNMRLVSAMHAVIDQEAEGDNLWRVVGGVEEAG